MDVLSSASSREEPFAIQLSSRHSNYMVEAYSFGGLTVTQFLYLPYMMGGSSFLGLVPPDDMVSSESVMGIKPGDFGVDSGLPAVQENE